MGNVIDEKIVGMRFDNEDFERNVKESMSTLKKLRESLNFDGAEKSFEKIKRVTESIDFDYLTDGIDKSTKSYKSFLDTVGDIWAIKKAVEAIDGFYNSIIRSVKAMSVDQFTAGWSKYADKTQAVQTIMSATHKSIEEVNESLEMLNWFSDETSYSFTDMTTSIGKFTSAGIDLNTAVKAVMGISTWAAKAGQGPAEASRAMYNLAQAMSVGSVKAIDWRSIENANMSTTEFKQAALDAAVAVGTLRKQGDKYLTVAKGTEVTVSSFTSTLQEGWFTTEALLKTLGRYGGYAEDLYHFMQDSNGEFETANQAMEAYTGTVDELGRSAFVAGQEAISLNQAIEATKDAVSSGWMNIFELIFGNYEEAKKSWTQLSLTLWDIFAGGFSNHQDYLKEALSNTGRSLFEGALESVGINSEAFYKAAAETLKKTGFDFSIYEGKYDTPEDVLKNDSFLLTPKVISDSLNLISDTLSLQNDSVYKNLENWRALIKQVEDYGGSVEDVEREVSKALAEQGIDMEALIKEYGSFEAAVANSKVVSGDILGQVFDRLSGTALDYSKTIKGGNLTMKEFDQIYSDVFLNKYGTGTDRVEAFTKAGLDAAKVQELINKKAHGGIITSEDLIGLRLEETKKVEKLSEFYQQLGEMYEFSGKSAEELAEFVLESGNDVNWLANNLDGMTGRELIFDTILAPLKNLSNILYAIRNAWNETFLQNPIGLLKTIANVNVFIHSLDLSEERIKDIHDAFTGVFSILKIVGGLIKATFSFFSRPFKNIPIFLNTTIRLLGILGRAVTAISDFLIVDIQNFFRNVPNYISNAFSKISEFLSPLKEKFFSLFNNDDGTNRLLDLIERIKKGFEILKEKASEIRKVLKSVFFIDKENVDPNAIAVGLIDKIKEAYNNLLPIFNEIKAKIADLFGPEIEKAKKVIDVIKEKFESVKKVVTDLINKIKGFFGGGESDELIRGSVLDEGGGRKKKSKTGDLVDKLISGKGLTKLDILKGNLKYIKDKILNFLQNTTVFKKVKDFFSTNLSPSFEKGLNFIKDKLSSLKEGLSKSGLFDRIKNFFSQKVSPNLEKGLNFVKNKFNSLKDSVSKGNFFERIKNFFSQKVSPNLENGFDSLKEKFNSLKELIKNNPFFSTIKDFFNSFWQNLKQPIADLINNFRKKLSKLSESKKSDSGSGSGSKQSFIDTISIMIFGVDFETLKGNIASIREYISNGLSSAWEVVKHYAGIAGDFISQHRVAVGAGSLGLIGAILGISNARYQRNLITGLAKALESFLGSGGNMFNALSAFIKHTDQAQNAVKKKSFSETFLELSKAIALIAVSIFILGNMDTEKAIQGAIGVAGVITAMTVAMEATANIYGIDGGKGSALESIGKMVLEMAGIVVILSRLDFGKVLKGVIGIGAIFAILVKAFQILSKNGTNINIGKDILDGLTTAIRNMAGVVAVLGKMDIEKLGKGFLGLATIMAILGLFLVLVSKNGKTIGTSEKTITAISKVVLEFAGIVELLGNMDFWKMEQGALGLLEIVGILAVLFIAISKLAPTISVGLGVLAGVALVVGVMAGIVSLLSNAENIQNGLLALAEIIGLFTLVGAAMAGFSVIAAPALLGASLFALFALEIAGITAGIHAIISNLSGLPELAEGLSVFATKLEPFVESCERLHNINLASAISDMTSALLILFAGTFTDTIIQGLTGHSVFELLGRELELLGQALKKFVVGLFEVDEATDKDINVDTDRIKNALAIIPELGKIMEMDFSKTSIIGGFFRGNLSSFALSIKDLGSGFAAFASSITESNLFSTSSKLPSEGSVDSKISQIEAVIDIIERLAGIEVPARFSVSGIVIPVFGLIQGQASNTLEGLGTDLKLFASKQGFGGFIDAITTSDLFTKTFGKVRDEEGNVNENIASIVAAIKIMDLLAKIEVPTSFKVEAGIAIFPALGFVNGTISNDFATWGKDLGNFANEKNGFVYFLNSIVDSKLFSAPLNTLETENSNVDTNIAAIESVIGIIDSLSQITPPTQFKVSVGLSFLSALGFTGNGTVTHDFESLGKDLKAFGGEDGFVGFMNQIVTSGIFTNKLSAPEDTGNIDQINAAIDIIDRLAQMKVPTYFSADVGIPILNSLGKFSIKANSSLATFGSDLNQFASEDGFIGFVREILDSELFTGEITFKDGSIENATGNIAAISAAVDIIATLASIDPPVVESSWLTNLLNKGDKSLETLGENLPDFATAVLGFVNILNSKDVEGNYDIDDDVVHRVESAVGIIDKLVGIQMPNERGWLDTFALGAFAEDFKSIGDSLAGFIGQINEYTVFSEFKTDAPAVDNAIKAMDILKELVAIELPESGTFFERLLGISNSLENYSIGVNDIGIALHNIIVGLNGLDKEGNKVDSVQFTQEHIDKVLSVIPVLRELASIPLYNIGSIVDNWDKMAGLGEGLRDLIIGFNTAMESGDKIDDAQIDNILKILPILSTLSYVSQNIEFEGYKNFKKFAESSSDLVAPIMAFVRSIQNGLNELNEESIDFDQINTIVSLVSSIATVLKSDSEYNAETFKGETIIAKLGRDISGFVQRVNDNILNETAVNRIIALIDKLFESDETSFHTFVTNLNTDIISLNTTLSTIQADFYTLGMNIALGLANGMDAGNVLYVQPAATRLGTSALGSTEESVDSHSPSKEFEKIGKYIDQGLAIGIDANAKLAEIAAENLGKGTLNEFTDFKDKIFKATMLDEDIFGLGNLDIFEDSDFLSSIGDRIKGNLIDGSEAGEGFGGSLIDSLLSVFKRSDDEIEEVAEDTAADVVEGTFTGANDKSVEELEEATQDDIAGVADVTLNEFESRKKDMIDSGQELVLELAKAVLANSAKFSEAGKALGGAMHEGLIEGLDPDKLQNLADIMRTIEALSSGAMNTYVNRFQESMNRIAEILNELDIDTDKLSILSNFLTALSQFDMSNLNVDSGVLSTFIAAIVSAIDENSEEIRSAMVSLATLMLEVLEEYEGKFYSKGSELIHELAEGMVSGIEYATNAVSIVCGAILDAFDAQGKEQISKEGETFMQEFANGMTSEAAKQSIVDAIDKVFNGSEETTSDRVEEVDEQGRITVSGVDISTGEDGEKKSIGQKFGEQFVKDFQETVTGSGGLQDTVDAIGDSFSSLSESVTSLNESVDLTEFTTSMASQLESAHSEIEPSATKLRSLIGGIVPDGKGKVIAMMEGMIVAFNDDDKVKEVVAAAMAFANKVSAALAVAWQEHSPSRLTRRMGEYLIEGVKLGIEDKGKTAVDSMSKFASAVVSAGDEAFQSFDQDESAIKNAASILSNILELVDEDLDIDPVISPVVDLSGIQRGATDIDSILSRKHAYEINARMSRQQQEAFLQNRSDSAKNSGSSVYNFTQNNYSPKALSRLEIYRQTKNQFAMLKGAGK